MNASTGSSPLEGALPSVGQSEMGTSWVLKGKEISLKEPEVTRQRMTLMRGMKSVGKGAA